MRLSDGGVLDPARVLKEGPDEVRQTLAAHHNLLDDDVEVREAEAQRLLRAIDAANALECPVVLTRIGGALIESGYDYVMCVENEDRGMPGLDGLAYGCRHLRQVLPRKGEHEVPMGPWKVR